MIRTDAGHVGVKVGDKSYTLIPSLINISKIGTPREIVGCFSSIDNPAKFYYEFVDGQPQVVGFDMAVGFEAAAWVLQCCGLPESVTGSVVSRGDSNGRPCFYVLLGKLPSHDVFVLAAHCLKHGVCGEFNSDSKSEPMTEFDAHYFIHLAHKVLDISIEEARNLTMTELSIYCEAEKQLNSGEKTKKAELSQQNNAFDWFNNRKGRH